MPSVLETLPKQSVEPLPTAPTGYVINQGSVYDASGLFGYSNFELSSVFRTTGDTTSSILRYLKNQPLKESDIPLLEGYTLKRLNEYRPWLAHHAEHPKGSQYGGSFNIGNAFERAFTFRESSFQPANIIRGLSVGTVTVLTGGLSLAEPKINGVTLASSNPDSSSPGLLDAGYTGANSFGIVRAGNPNVAETGFNRIARLIGGTISSIATGKAFTNYLKTPPSISGGNPAITQGPPAPLSLAQQSGRVAGYGAATSLQGLGLSNIAQGVVQVFGQKVGGALLALVSGNVAEAINIITSNPPSSGNLLYGPTGGGGGGGGGYSPTQNTGQTNLASVMMPVLILSVLGLVLWYFLRKKA